MLPEQIAEECEEFLISCPIYLVYKWPPMSEISYAYSWAHEMHQQLPVRYPDIPRVIMNGVLAFHHGITTADNERIKELDEKNK